MTIRRALALIALLAVAGSVDAAARLSPLVREAIARLRPPP